MGGERIPDVIVDRIGQVAGLVTIWSPRASPSYWVNRERSTAREAGLRECLLRVPGTPLPDDWPREGGYPVEFYESLEGVITGLADAPGVDSGRGFSVDEDKFAELVGKVRQFSAAASQERQSRAQGTPRGRLLLELYREFDAKVRSIPTVLNFVQMDPELFHLPRYERARADGSIYSVLDEEDRGLLVTQAPQPAGGFSAPGILERFLREGARLVQYSGRELELKGQLTEAGTGNELRVFGMTILPGELRSFRSYLVRLGLMAEPA